jgi:hypothetical protein
VRYLSIIYLFYRPNTINNIISIMPSFSLRKLRSRSNSQQRLKNDDEGGGGKRTHTSSPKSTPKPSSTTTRSKQSQAAAGIVSPEGLKFLGSKQGTNTSQTKMYTMSSGSTTLPNKKRIGRQISNGSVDSMAYSSNASEASDGVFITAFDRCPPTFSDDALDRDIFPTPSADIVGGNYSRTWEADHDLAVLEEMSNEWTMFSDPNFENRNNPMNASKNMGALQRDDQNNQQVMDNSLSAIPKEKIARLVSPDRNTMPVFNQTIAGASSAAVTTPNDDLSAWGFAAAAAAAASTDNRESETIKRSTTTTQKTDELQDAFGSNFFISSGFDDDDGFFGQSDWTAMSSPISPANDNMSGVVEGDDEENYPWGKTPGGVNPFEEKKDEDTGSVIFTNVSFPDPITPTTEPTFSHPLKQQLQHKRKENKEVVVSFEDYNHEIMQSPSNSSFSSRPTAERNLHYERNNRPPVTSKSHRRINSNGSGSRRRGGKSGGSVGSNSSAVDQILEHYRQKRLAKNNGKASSAASSTVSSQPSSSNHRSIPSLDSLSSVPSSDMAAVTAAAPAAAALSIMHSQKSSHLNDTVTSVQSTSSGPMSPSQSPPPLPTNQSNNSRVVNWPDDDGVICSAAAPPSPSRNVNETARVDDAADRFLMANIEATIGPRGIAPDMESLSGRSCNRSPRLRNHQASDAKSIDSRTSRNSRYSFHTYDSNRSALKGIINMSPESKSVANDLFRLEAQLAEVARQQELQGDESVSSPREVIFVGDNTLNINNSSNSDVSNNNGYIGAEPVPRLNPITVVAPPGKLGILLSNNKAGGVSPTPTHVSAVRSESVLAGKVQVGDQLMKIDGQDVSRCNSKQIMAIMARKSELERVLEFRCLESSYDPHEWI